MKNKHNETLADLLLEVSYLPRGLDQEIPVAAGDGC